jgi:hypothetical protein
MYMEPYPEYSWGYKVDKAAKPSLRRVGSRCEHVIGRTCKEQHIHSDLHNNNRWPVCRENWLGCEHIDFENESDLENGFNLEDELLTRVAKPESLGNITWVEASLKVMEGGTDARSDSGLFLNGAELAEERLRFSPTD